MRGGTHTRMRGGTHTRMRGHSYTRGHSHTHVASLCDPVCLHECAFLSTLLRKFDKASNQFKVSHHLIKTEGNDFRIDGITVSTVYWLMVGLGPTTCTELEKHYSATTPSHTKVPLSEATLHFSRDHLSIVNPNITSPLSTQTPPFHCPSKHHLSTVHPNTTSPLSVQTPPRPATPCLCVFSTPHLSPCRHSQEQIF